MPAISAELRDRTSARVGRCEAAAISDDHILTTSLPLFGMLGGFRFYMPLRLFTKRSAGIRFKLCANAFLKMLVTVLLRWQLHNSGHLEWLPMSVPERSDQITVHPPDELQGYLFRTYRLTLAMIRAAAEKFVSHRSHHA